MPVLDSPPPEGLNDLRADIVEAAKGLEDRIFSVLDRLVVLHRDRVAAEQALAKCRAAEDVAREEYELITHHAAGFAHGAIDAIIKKNYTALTYQIERRVESEVRTRVAAELAKPREPRETIVPGPSGGVYTHEDPR